MKNEDMKLEIIFLSLIFLVLLLLAEISLAEIIFQDDFESDPSDWVCRDSAQDPYPWNALFKWDGIWMSCGWDDDFGALWRMGPGYNSNNALYAWRYGNHKGYESANTKWFSGDEIKTEIYHRWYMKMPPSSRFNIDTSYCGGVKLWRYYTREYGYGPTYGGEIYLNFHGWQNLSESNLTLLTSTGQYGSQIWPLKSVSEFNDDNWHSHEIRIKLNSNGNSDGIIEYWFDGNLEKTYKNINFGFDSAQPIAIHSFGVGLGNACWMSPTEWLQTEWSAIGFDNVVVSTSYIGPIERLPDTTPPAAPRNLKVF